MDFSTMAPQLVELVGGAENVSGLTHCVTRLRFKLRDDSKADQKAIENLDGVKGVVKASGQFQVIIGAGVEDAYAAVAPLVGVSADVPTAADDAANGKPHGIKGYASMALDTLISCFTPIIPAIAGAGLIKVLCYLLTAFGALTADSITYQVLSVIGDGVYYFLPFLVAVTAAEKMKVNKFLAIGLTGIMMHPTLLTLGDAGSTVSFLGLPLTITDYSTQALPIILSVWLLKYVDKFSQKICPDMLKSFVAPMLSFLITAPIALIVIGPLGSIIGVYFAQFCNLMNQWGWIAVGLNAVIFPFLVLTGMHNALIPLMIQMFATQGFDPVLVPSGLIANIAESGAAAAVAVRTKSKKMRGIAGSAAFSALFGITEPALYGVNLRYKRPFVAMLIGALVGGCFAGLFGLTAYTFVNPSIISLPIFAGPNSNFLLSIASVPITWVVTFVVALAMGFKEDDAETETAGAAA